VLPLRVSLGLAHPAGLNVLHVENCGFGSGLP
jgi:hypothetical protein